MAVKRTTLSRPRPSALVRAEHGGAPVRLTPSERQVFGEALRLGADLAGEVEAKVSAYGRWLLEAVFANDAAAALDGKTKNPVWMDLVRRAGGPTLQLSKRMRYVAVQLAAYDKRISDQTWRGLEGAVGHRKPSLDRRSAVSCPRGRTGSASRAGRASALGRKRTSLDSCEMALVVETRTEVASRSSGSSTCVTASSSCTARSCAAPTRASSRTARAAACVSRRSRTSRSR
jgi:hypothetical protein